MFNRPACLLCLSVFAVVVTALLSGSGTSATSEVKVAARYHLRTRTSSFYQRSAISNVNPTKPTTSAR